MDKNTININLGRIFDQQKSQTSQQNDKKPSSSHFKTLEELSRYVSLANTTRNFIYYLFLDRYSMIYLLSLPIGCEYNIIKYNIVDITYETSYYSYSNYMINENNDDSINNYLGLLRKFVGNKYPPYLSLIHRKNLLYQHELISNKLLPNIKLSTKNTRDTIFQIIYTLLCIYMNKYTITNINILHVMLPSPITLEFTIGNLLFTLTNVMVIPIITFVSNKTKVEYFENIDNSKILESYNNIMQNIISNRYTDFLSPIIDIDPIECLISYLLIEYKSESNICKFDELTDKFKNKFKNKGCLSTVVDYGRVFQKDDHMYVKLGRNKFLNITTNIIDDENINELIELYHIKENVPVTRTVNPNVVSYSFGFNI